MPIERLQKLMVRTTIWEEKKSLPVTALRYRFREENWVTIVEKKRRETWRRKNPVNYWHARFKAK